jgi:hypothetical protein
MTGNILAATTVVLLSAVLVGLWRLLPHHDVAVSVCWAIAGFALFELVPAFGDLLQHTTGVLVGSSLGLIITVSDRRQEQAKRRRSALLEA